jgi:anaerobic selenocysteine-containing dehydrogenase
MIHERKDMITGAQRDAVFMSREDAERLGLQAGDPITLRNEIGQYCGRVFLAPVKPGNLQIHWPEGNVLIRRDLRSPDAGIPDYNALAWLESGQVDDIAAAGAHDAGAP